jgi:hypothetical protein
VNKDDLTLDHDVLDALHAALPAAARRTVAALGDELPAYNRAALGTDFSATLERAVEMALAGFLRVADEGPLTARRMPSAPAVDAADELGRGEARTGRPIEVLLAAYRIGARVAWQDLSRVMVERDVPAATVAHYAELVFAYIDQLSAASVTGHNDETSASVRERERSLERLAAALLAGAPAAELDALAVGADWAPPTTLTAVVLPAAQLRQALHAVAPATLTVRSGVAPGAPEGVGVLLVPDLDRGRARLLDALDGRGAVVGPTRPWTEAHRSYDRARRVAALVTPSGTTTDTEVHLAALVIGADADALDDIRRRALEPLAGTRPATAARLAETLRSWLLHQGRRDEVAAELHVHPQTVRYRMTQIRELFGDRLTDPRAVLDLVLALSAPADPYRGEG